MIKIKTLLAKNTIKTEGCDPTSFGPNPDATEGTQNNPYVEWNKRMQQMEENDLPLSGEEKYNKQEPGGTMMAVNIDENNELDDIINNSGLNERERMVIDRKREGLTTKEIAQLYNTSEGRIRGIYKRAFDKLKKFSVKESDTNLHGRPAQEAGAMDLQSTFT